MYQLINYRQATCLAASIKPFAVGLFWELRAPGTGAGGDTPLQEGGLGAAPGAGAWLCRSGRRTPTHPENCPSSPLSRLRRHETWVQN